jgi:hypothetical protein
MASVSGARDSGRARADRSTATLVELLRRIACRLLFLAMLAGIVSTIAANPRHVDDVTAVQSSPQRHVTSGAPRQIVDQQTGK